MKKILSIAAASAIAAFAATGAQAATTKVCAVYVGPIGDFGWTYQHHQGLMDVKAAYGDKVETAHL